MRDFASTSIVNRRHSIKKVRKPWGHELIWATTKRYAGKILVINKGHRLSYQYHRRKEETILLIKGLLRFEYARNGGARRTRLLRPGEAFHIPPGLRHRMEAIKKCEVFEVSSPELQDVIRLQDDYQRL